MRIGTRGSALALKQARWVAQRLGEGVELVAIATAGDRAERLADKSRWVSELEQALLDGRIELAVHSAKDVPAELAEGLELVAIPAREDPRDAICGVSSLDDLGAGARVGTSSLRRAAQLRALRSDLEVVAVRGNVDTRLRKLAEGQVDALVVALAGLRRLGREAAAGGVLADLVPAAGQGALALEAHPGAIPAKLLAAIHDPDTAACVAAERALTRALGASCNTAVGAHARLAGDGQLELHAWVGLPDGSQWIADRLVGSGPELGGAVAARLREAGADELLRAAEHEAERAAEEAERRAKQGADRAVERAAEEAERRAKQGADREVERAAEEAERRAKQGADRDAKRAAAEAERRAKPGADREIEREPTGGAPA